MKSAAHVQLKAIYETYTRLLPKWTFPAVPFIIAALFQVYAWFGGRYLVKYTLLPRVLILWLFALGEYSFMSPAMNASQEVVGMSENVIIILYHAATLVVFTFVSFFVFKNTFTWKHIVALLLLGISILLVYL